MTWTSNNNNNKISNWANQCKHISIILNKTILHPLVVIAPETWADNSSTMEVLPWANNENMSQVNPAFSTFSSIKVTHFKLRLIIWARNSMNRKLRALILSTLINLESRDLFPTLQEIAPNLLVRDLTGFLYLLIQVSSYVTSDSRASKNLLCLSSKIIYRPDQPGLLLQGPKVFQDCNISDHLLPWPKEKQS